MTDPVQAELKTLRRKVDALTALLHFASAPEYGAFTTGTDSWFACRGPDTELESAETPEELAEQLGILPKEEA